MIHPGWLAATNAPRRRPAGYPSVVVKTHMGLFPTS